MSHKNSRKWRSCESKVKYPTQAAADKRARVVRRMTLKAYRCRFCNRWHIGHCAWCQPNTARGWHDLQPARCSAFRGLFSYWKI